MALFLAEHTHPAEACPAGRPEIAPHLLQLVSDASAAKHGLRIHGDAVLTGRHHLYLIVEGKNAEAVHSYLAPFGQMGTLQVTPASHCEEVVGRGKC